MVQRAAFRSQHPAAVAQFSQAQRAHAQRVAHAEKGVLGHNGQRIGALKAVHGLPDAGGQSFSVEASMRLAIVSESVVVLKA